MQIADLFEVLISKLYLGLNRDWRLARLLVKINDLNWLFILMSRGKIHFKAILPFIFLDGVRLFIWNLNLCRFWIMIAFSVSDHWQSLQEDIILVVLILMLSSWNDLLWFLWNKSGIGGELNHRIVLILLHILYFIIPLNGLLDFVMVIGYDKHKPDHNSWWVKPASE